MCNKLQCIQYYTLQPQRIASFGSAVCCTYCEIFRFVIALNKREAKTNKKASFFRCSFYFYANIVFIVKIFKKRTNRVIESTEREIHSVWSSISYQTHFIFLKNNLIHFILFLVLKMLSSMSVHFPYTMYTYNVVLRMVYLDEVFCCACAALCGCVSVSSCC